MLKTSFVSAEGVITLPEAMMNQVGIEHGSKIELEVRDGAILIRKQLPISAYMGILKGYDLGDIEPTKEPDKDWP